MMKNNIFRIMIVLCSLGIGGAALGYGDSLVSLGNRYDRVLKKNTKRGAIYSMDDLTTTYKWYATYHSPKFRKAFMARYDKYYPHGQDEYARKFVEGSAGPDQTEFFVALYSRERGLKRMTGKKNLWDIRLEVRNQILKPITLEEVFITPLQKGFYPYLDKWFRGYRVIFPIASADIADKEIKLHLSSIAGESKLSF